MTVDKRLESMGGEGENARGILQSLKAADGRFREVKKSRLHCAECRGSKGNSRSPLLVMQAIGRDDEGQLRNWILLAGHKTRRQVIPWTAYALGVYQGPLIVTCPHCAHTLLLTASPPANIHVTSLGRATEGVVTE